MRTLLHAVPPPRPLPAKLKGWALGTVETVVIVALCAALGMAVLRAWYGKAVCGVEPAQAVK